MSARSSGRGDLFKIGEVAKLFRISVATLRHYDERGLVCPEFVDADTGYRYYSVRQFERLNTIRYLRALGTPLEAIARFLDNREIEGMWSVLAAQRDEVRRRKAELDLVERKLDRRLAQIADALESRLDVVEECVLPPRRLALIRASVAPRDYLDLELPIRELEDAAGEAVAFLGKVGVGLSPDALARGDFSSYETVFLLLDDEDSFGGATLDLPEETCLRLRFCGGHADAPVRYARLMAYVEKDGYRLTGFSREITLIDDGFTSDASQFVTEIQIPVCRVERKSS